MNDEEKVIGRGTQTNPTNRFLHSEYIAPIDWNDIEPEDRPSPKTIFVKDFSKSAIAENKSPDVGFDFSVNPYRGCEHGCIYCYARPTHEYLGFSAGLDFETKILVKENIASLLREELSKKSWKPAVINLSGVTDCYQPVERKLKLTRACLEVLLDFKNPATLITKSQLITRDIDLFKQMPSYRGVGIFISMTTLDNDIASKMEPRTSRPQARLDAVKKLADAGIPVGVMLAPMIVGLTEHELPRILEESAKAGARFAGYVPLRLPYGVKNLFVEWLEKNFPLKRDRIVHLIESIRDGKLNDSEFGTRMTGSGNYAENLSKLFDLFTRKYHLNEARLNLSTSSFRVPSPQLSLF